jgi:toxin HigB-1
VRLGMGGKAMKDAGKKGLARAAFGVTLHRTDNLIDCPCMKIASVRHKGLRRVMEEDDRSGLPAAVIDKVLDILAFLQDMENEDELKSLTSWKPHQMKGDRKGTWALHVTKNWRITFEIDRKEIEIIDLDYEDFH